jgi:putative hydrolase of the HAD superfamily
VTALRGVLLDLDDTLLDHHGAVGSALAAWLPSMGVPYTPALHTLWDDIAERHLRRWRERRITFREQRRRRLRDFLPAAGIRYAPGTLDDVFAQYLTAYEAAWRPFPDVAGALTAIADAGLRVAVLTNGSAAQQNAKLTRTALAGRIGAVFTPDDLGVAKPEPAAFRLACARWSLPPGAVLSVGDNYAFDVLPARAAGLRAAYLDRRGVGPLGEASRLTSLSELPALLA